MVEFALVLPLLVMLLMGTITGGLAYYEKISVADAVREGARFGATADFTDAGAWTDAVAARTRSAATGVLDPSDPEVVVCVDAPGASSCPVAPGSAPPPASVGTCYVHIHVQKPLWLSIGLHDWEPVLTEDAYARYERECP